MLFHKYRAHEAQKRACPRRAKPYHRDNCHECRNDILWWEAAGARASGAFTDRELMWFAAGHAVAWPVLAPAVQAVKFMTRNAPLAPREKEAQVKALEAENERLSKEIDQLRKP